MVPDASGAIELPLNTTAGKRLAARLADDTEAVHVGKEPPADVGPREACSAMPLDTAASGTSRRFR